MEGLHEALGHIFIKFMERAFTYAVIIVVFCYHLIFDVDLPCTCENHDQDCAFYMAVPFLIILFAQLCVDRRFHRACSLSSATCWVALSRGLKALFVALIWMVLVLVDGDWMLCCIDDIKQNISCQNEFQLTNEHHRHVTEWKNTSRIIGLSLLLCMVFAAFLASLGKKKFSKSHQGFLAEIVLEKEEKLLTENLEKVVDDKLKTKLNDHIDKSEWQKCLWVGNQLLTEMLSEKTQSTSSTAAPEGGAAEEGSSSREPLLPAGVPSEEHRDGGGAAQQRTPAASEHIGLL